MKPKIGLALAGGGARGAFQLPILEALETAGILDQVSVIAGTSIGSLHAVMVASRRVDHIRHVWETLDASVFQFTAKELFERAKQLEFHVIKEGLMPVDVLEKVLDDSLPLMVLGDRDVFITTTCMGSEEATLAHAIAYNLKAFIKGQLPVEFQNIKDASASQIKQALLASTAIPMIFKPVRNETKTLVDGGLYANLPLKPLVDAGCTHIIALDLYRFNLSRKATIGDTKVFYFHPQKSLGGILDFKEERLRDRLEHASAIAQEKVPLLQEMLS
jgi:NTE family protein